MNGAPRIALFIDGANLYATSKQLGFDMDYRRLLREFQGRGNLIRAFYFTTLVESEEYSSIRPLVDWLDYNGYRVITKAAKEFTDATGRRRVKGNMDIELAIEMLELAPHLDQIYLFSGDGDFRPLVEAVQRKGVKVSVVSTISTNPPMVSDELRRQCDEFVDLAQLMPKVGRDPAERASRSLARELPGLVIALHAASEWADHPAALERCLADIAAGDVILATMLFMEDHFRPVLDALRARRDGCDAMVCAMSAGEYLLRYSVQEHSQYLAQEASSAVQRRATSK